MTATFISYRQEDKDFLAEVRTFAKRLADAGVDIILDQLYMDAHPGGPDEGWDRWSATQVKRAERVLIVCSPGWFASFEGTQPAEEGLGAACEARMIYTELYGSAFKSGKHRLLVLANREPKTIPLELEHIHRFHSDDDFDRIVAWLHGPEAARKAADDRAEGAHWPEPLEDFVPDFADRQEVWPMMVRLLTGDAKRRILILEGKTNHGKSGLIRECLRYARETDLLVAPIDLKGGHRSVADILAELDLNLGAHLPEFSKAGGRDPHLLRKDLRRLSRPLLVLLDTYEQARANREITDWLEHQLLADVEACDALVVVIAGQEAPTSTGALWKEQARHFRLGPITEPEAWEHWVRRRFPRLEQANVDINTLVLASGGVPGTMAVMCTGIDDRLASGGA